MSCPPIRLHSVTASDVAALAALDLPAGVDVWMYPLDEQESAAPSRYMLLSEPEKDRARRFRRAVHERRYVAAHATLRLILSAYVGVPPVALTLVDGFAGKPSLANDGIPEGFEFNLSHSNEWAIVGVTTAGALGVDIEHVRERVDHVALFDRYFSAGEIAGIRALPAGMWQRAFFALWTRKEAFIKALGSGLSRPLDSFEISVHPDEVPVLLADHEAGGVVQDWCMYSLLHSETQFVSAALKLR